MTNPRRAVILIDVQQEYFTGPLEVRYPAPADALRQIIAVIDTAAAENIPVAVVQHDGGNQSPVFNPTTDRFALHPEIEAKRTDAWKPIVKHYSSVFADTDLHAWLQQHDVDTVTLTGFMTNNCVLATAAEAEHLGVQVEVISDATGAIALSNEAGTVDARTLHEAIMALLHSNWAAVIDTDAWTEQAHSTTATAKSNLVTSALAGAQHVG